jgi:putative transposase
MARNVRLEYAGAFYHVMARGNRRQAIFWDEDDRRCWLSTLSEACGRTGWHVHAWVVLDNHYHLVVGTPEPNLVAGMKWLQNTYTRRFNTRHRLWGRLFGDRYKAIPVEGRSGDFYGGLVNYVHLNPARARLIDASRGQSLLDYPWSSLAQGFARPVKQRPGWLAAASALAAFGCADTAAGRRRYVERLDEIARSEPGAQCGVPPAPPDARMSHVRRGWYWGSQAFAEELLGLLSAGPNRATNRTYRSSLEHRAHGEQQAEALLAEGLRAHQLSPPMLVSLPGTDPRKIAVAQRLWANTTASQAWIAQRLHMKSAANVSQILRRQKTSHLSRYVD